MKRRSCIVLFTAAVLSVNACSTAASRSSADNSVGPETKVAVNSASANLTKIEITPGGPADTVRAFYRHLREKRFREAIFLTNLRPAVEGLTENELKDFALDFEALAGKVPAEIEINGEIVTGDRAIVTANLPAADSDRKETQQISLRRAGDIWIIQTVDDAAEAKIRADGKQYFYNLRISTHEDEARAMLDRVSKAQIAYALQNNSLYSDIPGLIGAGLLPDDARDSQSTGYNYAIELSPDKRSYTATATPARYGQSGKLSFLLAPDARGWRITSKDNVGKVLRK